MIQTTLLADYAAKDRWQPVVQPFRPRSAIKVRRTKPVPGQLILPGMELTEDSREVALPDQEDDLALCEGPSGSAAGPQPTCPNCGGMEFDEDGDCMSCWEPAVARPIGGAG